MKVGLNVNVALAIDEETQNTKQENMKEKPPIERNYPATKPPKKKGRPR